MVVSQESDIISLKKQLDGIITPNLKSGSIKTSEGNEEITNTKEPLLYQNTPNPFTNITEIKCYIPSDFKNAYVYIHDFQGNQIKAFNLSSMGLNTVQINGSELQAGIYVYTLVVDNTQIDSKRMLLTK